MISPISEILGISIKPTIGIGDGIQFSSVPENYFRATGKKLVDVSQPWFFDDNPFVVRNGAKPTRTVEMWNFSPKQYDWPKLRPQGVYLSNAEIFAAVLGVPAVLNRPRIYRHETFPFEKRERILFHTHGTSHGTMPEHVIEHVLRKYRPTGRLYHIGPNGTPDYGIPKLVTSTLWELARVISEAQMLIGMDSGPSWIAACYPDVVVKKLRTKPGIDALKTWVPLSMDNIHSHWDDRCHQIFNVSDQDVGFISTYRKI